MLSKKRQATEGGSLEWVAITDLGFDIRVNRDVDFGWVTDIARRFDPAKLGTFEVSRRDNGALIVIEGQHRALAARDVGWAGDVPCHITEGLSLDQEIEAVLSSNNKRGFSSIDKFVKNAAMGQEPYAAVNEIVVSAGLTVSRKITAIRCPSVLVAVHRKHGPQVLTAAIETARDAWAQDDNRSAFSAACLGGLGEFYALHITRLDQDEVVRKLRTEIDPAHITGTAKSRARFEGGTAAEYACDIITGAYNRRRSVGRI